MARKATGAVVPHMGKDGRTYYGLRFTAYGKRRFVSLGAVSEADAQRRLRHVMADVERGVWQPAAGVEPPAELAPIPTFDEFAGEWWLRNRDQLRLTTQVDYALRLRRLLPFFGKMTLDRITYDTVERYISLEVAEQGRRATSLADWKRQIAEETDEVELAALRKQRPAKPLKPRTINMGLTLLGAILEGAVERDLMPKNPAKGKSRRVREHKPGRSYLEAADQIVTLLDAAAALDRAAPVSRQHVRRRAMLATLTFAGLRISELCALRWRSVDLAGGWLTVEESKTDAGTRKVKIRGGLRDELLAIRPVDAEPDAFVFATSTGGMPSQDNIRNRVLAPAVKLASEARIDSGRPPLPAITPHSLRRTFASVLYAIGETPPVVMAEMGHTSPALALAVYAQAMRREDQDVAELRALIDGAAQLAVMGRRDTVGTDSTVWSEVA